MTGRNNGTETRAYEVTQCDATTTLAPGGGTVEYEHEYEYEYDPIP